MIARLPTAIRSVLALALLAGCGNRALGLAELRGGVEMGVRRGAAWTTLTVKPPHIIGPRTNLSLRSDLLRGTIDGRGTSITMDETGAHGSGPFGSIAISIEDREDALVVEGTWNGSRAHFRVTQDSFRGTIPVVVGGTMEGVQSCQYTLDTLAPDGAWTGTSTCHGMPEQTRLEVPAKIQDWLTRKELTVVILVLLSSPPTTSLEDRFSQ